MDLIKNYENAVGESVKSFDDYLNGRNKLILENREDLKPEALTRMINEYDIEHKPKLIESVGKVEESGKKLNASLSKDLQSHGRAYTPETEADRITFLLEEQNFKDLLDVSKPEEIINNYEEAVKSGDAKLVQMYEDCGVINLKRRNSPIAGRMELYIERNVRSRMPESYTKAIKTIEKYKPLFGAANRVMQALENKKPDEWGINLHTWIGLSHSKLQERWNAKTINFVSKGIPVR